MTYFDHLVSSFPQTLNCTSDTLLLSFDSQFEKYLFLPVSEAAPFVIRNNFHWNFPSLQMPVHQLCPHHFEKNPPCQKTLRSPFVSLLGHTIEGQKVLIFSLERTT